MVFRREAAARLLETGEKRTYQITCRQCRGAHCVSLGLVSLVSLGNRQTNFVLFFDGKLLFWLAGGGGGLKSDIFIFIILQELKSKWGPLARHI